VGGEQREDEMEEDWRAIERGRETGRGEIEKEAGGGGRIGALYSCGGVVGKLNWSGDGCPKLSDAAEKELTSRRRGRKGRKRRGKYTKNKISN
jgi:hypothetical protein